MPRKIPPGEIWSDERIQEYLPYFDVHLPPKDYPKVWKAFILAWARELTILHTLDYLYPPYSFRDKVDTRLRLFNNNVRKVFDYADLLIVYNIADEVRLGTVTFDGET